MAKSVEEKELLKNLKKQYKSNQKKLRAEYLVSREYIQIPKEVILNGLIENEHKLADNYPVYYGYFYVVTCDKYPEGKVVRSDVQKDINFLKNSLARERKWKDVEVFSCNLFKRNLL